MEIKKLKKITSKITYPKKLREKVQVTLKIKMVELKPTQIKSSA